MKRKIVKFGGTAFRTIELGPKVPTQRTLKVEKENVIRKVVRKVGSEVAVPSELP